MNAPTRTFARRGKTCTIVEDEYVAEIVSGSTGANFNNVAYPINPGQAQLFPWLSKQAAQWEKYRFNQLQFYYKPEVSQYAAAGQTGKVLFGVDFDASDGPPIAKQNIEDTDPHTDCMPYDKMALSLSTRDIHSLYPTLYVRPAGLPGASDIKTYDAGNLNVATVAINANATKLGELRVKYSVTFSVPVLETGSGAPANNTVSVFHGTGQSVPNSGVAQTALFETAVLNPLGITGFATGALIAPAGNYLVFFGGNVTAGSGLGAIEYLTYVGATQQNIAALLESTSQIEPMFWASDGTVATAASLTITGSAGSGPDTMAASAIILAV
jgi:hypothetical protein